MKTLRAIAWLGVAMWVAVLLVTMLPMETPRGLISALSAVGLLTVPSTVCTSGYLSAHARCYICATVCLVFWPAAYLAVVTTRRLPEPWE